MNRINTKISKEQLIRVDQLHKFFRNEKNSYPVLEASNQEFVSDCIIWSAQRAVIRDGSGNCSFESILKDSQGFIEC